VPFASGVILGLLVKVGAKPAALFLSSASPKKIIESFLKINF
jgi:hypothetical protein